MPNQFDLRNSRFHLKDNSKVFDIENANVVINSDSFIKFSSFTSKVIKDIKCHNNLLTYKNIRFFSLYFFIGFSFLVFQFDLSSEIDLHPLLSFVVAILFMLVPALLVSFIAAFILQFSRYQKLLVKTFSIQYSNKVLRYKNTSKDVKVVKDLIGYTIYMYRDNESFPYIEFNVETTHEANSIKDFINQKRKSTTTEIVSKLKRLVYSN